ncbi:MAG: polysaccharide deacetylase family protein [Clostridium sp.]
MENNKSRRNRRNRRNRRKKVTLIVAVVVILGIGFGGYEIFSHKKDNVKATASEGQAADNTAKQEEEKPKPTDIMPGQNIINSADSYAVPANEVFDMISSSKPSNKTKEVFLTFDDGPSENTEAILKILKEEDVHATFFVLGSQIKEDKENKQLLKDELDSGNAIGNHTMSHDYHKLYPGNSVNVDVFMKEINQNNELMKSILGEDFNTTVLRMPGGYMSRKYYRDPHLKALNEAFAKQGIYSIDWDAETGDAESNSYSVEHLVNKAKQYMKSEDHVILLMHDAAAKKSTVKALPQIIKMFKENGFEFKVIKNAPVNNTDTKDTSSNK